MIPRGDSILVLPSSSMKASMKASTEERKVKNIWTMLQGLNAVETNDSLGVLLSPTQNRRSCLKGSWNGGYSSTSTFGSSFSSMSTSSGSSLSRRVTFDDHVTRKNFLPDWADPRVCTYEKDMALKASSPDCDDLRRVDLGHIQALRKEQQARCSSAATGADSSSVSPVSLVKEEWSARGLEFHIDEELCNRKARSRLQSTLRVLLLQARKASWEEMANAYAVVSRTSHVEAHRRGMLDELEAAHQVGETVMNVLMEHRKKQWRCGHMPEGPSTWMARRPLRRSRRFSELVVGEYDVVHGR